MSKCLGVLGEVEDDESPAVPVLRAAIRRWEEGLSLWQRVRWYLGGQPYEPLILDFPPGALE